MRFSRGDRVRVADSYHWAQGQYATITEPPAFVKELAGDWHGLHRLVQTTKGKQRYYWVTFDVPQVDAEGDGPYDGAEIPAADLRPLSASRRLFSRLRLTRRKPDT